MIKALMVRESEWMDGWWVIETEDGRRISDADVEGTAAEMLSIAAAIEAGTSVRHKRCAVVMAAGHSVFYSPRNSRLRAVVSMAVARELAADIRLKCSQADA